MASRLEGLTLALKVAREATEVVPVLNQILGAAAHISELAEKIRKKREDMYTLIEKVAIYAREIEMAVTGRTLDVQMERRLDRLYSVFAKVESLLTTEATAKKTPLRLLRDVFIVPNKAEVLANELEGEMKLLQLLISIDTRLALSDAADKAEAGSSYVGEFRRLRGSDVQKLGLMHWCYLQHGTILVYARVRVNGELMVIRYMETDEGTPLDPNDAEQHSQFPELVRRISTVHASHPAVVQLYGLREGPDAGFMVFRSGTYDILAFLRELKHSVQPDGSCPDPLSIRTLTLVHSSVAPRNDTDVAQCYKILDAAWYLKNKHCLVWLGYMATVDSFGEPRIGLFDDIEDGEVWEDGVSGILSLLQAIREPRATLSLRRTEIVERAYDGEFFRSLATPLAHRFWNRLRAERLPLEVDGYVYDSRPGDTGLSDSTIANAHEHFRDIWRARDDAESWCDELMPHVILQEPLPRAISTCWLFAAPNSGLGLTLKLTTQRDGNIRFTETVIKILSDSPLDRDLRDLLWIDDDFDGYIDLYELCTREVE